LPDLLHRARIPRLDGKQPLAEQPAMRSARSGSRSSTIVVNTVRPTAVAKGCAEGGAWLRA